MVDRETTPPATNSPATTSSPVTPARKRLKMSSPGPAAAKELTAETMNIQQPVSNDADAITATVTDDLLTADGEVEPVSSPMSLYETTLTSFRMTIITPIQASGAIIPDRLLSHHPFTQVIWSTAAGIRQYAKANIGDRATKSQCCPEPLFGHYSADHVLGNMRACKPAILCT